jgi:hypothetical protein
MKDYKSILLIFVSLLLLTVSLALLWTWGYNYGKKKYSPPTTVGVDSLGNKVLTKDSLNQLYINALNNLNTLDLALSKADSLKLDISFKLTEFNNLRDEIATLLSNPTDIEGLSAAQQKIGILQSKVDELRRQNLAIQQENKRLGILLDKLSKVDDSGNDVIAEAKTVITEQKQTLEKPNPSGILTISDLNIVGLTNDDINLTETDIADNLNRFSGSFLVRNNLSQNAFGEVMVVIIQPNGKVLQSSSWESGTFETKEGRKIYTSKVKFDCNKGELKKISFSVSANQYEKGNYQALIYQNGNLITKVSKSFN